MPSILARTLESFVTDTYGRDQWLATMRDARQDFESFEFFFEYPAEEIDRVFDATARRLRRTRAELMEDLGTYLVSHANVGGLRRLLRYGGADFESFLESLRELPDRARMVLPELALPNLRVRRLEGVGYALDCGGANTDMCCLLVGAIRAMADDYGALAMTELADPAPGRDGRIVVTILASGFSKGRVFDLARLGQ